MPSIYSQLSDDTYSIQSTIKFPQHIIYYAITYLFYYNRARVIFGL